MFGNISIKIAYEKKSMNCWLYLFTTGFKFQPICIHQRKKKYSNCKTINVMTTITTHFIHWEPFLDAVTGTCLEVRLCIKQNKSQLGILLK